MRDVLDQLAARTDALVDALDGCDDLMTPTALPGWSRLTIVCHLRYGADALHRMTRDALADRPTAFYPDGRDAQRPLTLGLRPGETATGAVGALAAASDRLHDAWSQVADWSVPIDEPEGVFPTMADLAILRLTEIEVHGTDLELGLPPWSDVLIAAALPRRLDRLRSRRPLTAGAWIVSGIRVGDEVSEPEHVDAPDRDLFAMLLGRLPLSESFSRAYPGP